LLLDNHTWVLDAPQLLRCADDYQALTALSPITWSCGPCVRCISSWATIRLRPEAPAFSAAASVRAADYTIGASRTPAASVLLRSLEASATYRGSLDRQWRKLSL